MGWIAVERGSGTTSDQRPVVVFGSEASHTPRTVLFGRTFPTRIPVLISDMTTTKGEDTCFLRFRELRPSSVKLFLQEEQSLDTEMVHTYEDISIFVAK